VKDIIVLILTGLGLGALMMAVMHGSRFIDKWLDEKL
jgi:hypothetical protein